MPAIAGKPPRPLPLNDNVFRNQIDCFCEETRLFFITVHGATPSSKRLRASEEYVNYEGKSQKAEENRKSFLL
jgi:hypothetical protein